MYLEKHIRVNGIAPGGVLTDIPLVMPPSDPFGFERTSSLLTHSPNMGMPEDIANAALFLASDESKFVNGVILTCDGGWTTF
jgi:NAD(P)-dependent dehydrogenase (short-subunit alcohol dehydrogenase family)